MGGRSWRQCMSLHMVPKLRRAMPPPYRIIASSIENYRRNWPAKKLVAALNQTNAPAD